MKINPGLPLGTRLFRDHAEGASEGQGTLEYVRIGSSP